MAQLIDSPPPYVDTGKFLSAYYTNQLMGVINGVGGTVFGANVPQWIDTGENTLNETENVFSIVHKYTTLKVKFDQVYSDQVVRVYLSTDDNVTGIKVYENGMPTGATTISIDLSANPGGFTVDYNQLYFVRLYISDTSSGYWKLAKIYELNSSAITKPTLSNITSSTVITKSYLDSLGNAARDLRNRLQPSSIPFVGFNIRSDIAGASNSYVRYKMKHISRWLHYGLKSAGSASNSTKIYMNGTLLQSFSNNGSIYVGAFDMQNLPGGISEPSLGAEVEFRWDVYVSTGTFTLYYFWELPYI